MAANSKREQIIVATQNILNAVPEIATVNRTLLTYSELQEFAGPQFPLCAIVGHLPVPVEKSDTRNGFVDQIKSSLKIDVVTYFQDYADEDTQISDLGDTIFAALYQDQDRGGLVLNTAIVPKENTNIWRPFVAFQMTVNHHYIHGIGGF